MAVKNIEGGRSKQQLRPQSPGSATAGQKISGREIRYYYSNVVILPFKTGAELANLLIRKYPYSITREALIKHVSKQLAELKKAKDH
jgi:hypothetical protein